MNIYFKRLFYIALIYISFAMIGAHNVCLAQDNTGETSEIEEVRRDIMAGAESEHKEEASKVILTLDDCIRMAEENHLPLKIAKKNVKVAEWRRFEAIRNMLPKFGLRWEEYSGSIYGRQFYGKKEGFDMQHTLFHGGELYFTMRQAETNLKIVKKEYARIRNELILQVKKAYYSLAKSKENLKLQRILSDNIARIYDMVGKEFESGIASNLEFLNVSSQTNQVRFQLVSAKGDVDVAELILKQAMNLDIQENIDIAEDSALVFERIEADFDVLLKKAITHRPEMQISSMMISYYMYGNKIAKAKGSLKIDGMFSWGLAREQYYARDLGPGDDVRDLEQQWYAGVKGSIPIGGNTAEYSYTKEVWVPVVSAYHGTETITNAVKFNVLDNLAYYSEKASSDVDLERSKQEFIKTKQDVTLEVKEGCFNYEKAVLQLETATNKVKYQETDLETTKFRRQMDEAQDSNVVDSMIKLAQEKFGYVQALADCQIAIASLEKAIGVPGYFTNQEIIDSNSDNTIKK